MCPRPRQFQPLYIPWGLATIEPTALASHAVELAACHRPDGLLVFDDTGITSHPDHQAATRAAALAATATKLPVLGWALPAAVADRLRAETGQPFTGQPPGRLDLCARVDRTRQRRAILRLAYGSCRLACRAGPLPSVSGPFATASGRMVPMQRT
jgi:hypothetical protein